MAEKYGQSPDDVELWSEYWFERAAALMYGEDLHSKKADARERKRGRRNRMR